MNIKRPLMPGFLKRAEQKLLLNKPGIWSTRVHLVVYYGILFLLALTVLCFLDPNDLRNSSNTEGWVGFVSMIGGIGLIVWLIYLLRFNVFKKYGIIHPLHGLVTFLLYFISTGIIVSFSYVHPVVESVRANRAYTTKEIVTDINDINTKVYQLEYNMLDEKWDHDTIELVKKDTVEPVQDAAAEEDVDTAPAVVATKEYDYFQFDSSQFYNRINEVDSIIKLKDSLCVVYETPQFVFLNPYLRNAEAKELVLNNFQLFNKVHGHAPTPAQREVIKRELNALLKKYEYPQDITYPPVEIKQEDSHRDIIEKKYNVGIAESSISDIAEKKYRWSENNLQVSIRIFYYLTLGFTLLIFIFRHTTVRTFFLSILTGVLITIITALIVSFTRLEAIQFLVWLIMYVVLFLILSLMIFRAKKRSVINGIALNIFTLIITAMPITFLVLYYEYKRHLLRLNDIYEEPFDLEKYAVYAEVGGLVLLLVLLSTYISRAYRRWYSLPEN